MRTLRHGHRLCRQLLPLVLLAALITVWTSASPARAAGPTEVTGFGSNPGNLRMFRYVPPGLPGNAPVVVALHGCTQSAAAYDDEPGWTALADRWKFVLVLPQQQSANNANSCFSWFESADTARGSGEALSIKQMVDRTKADSTVDAGRVFVTGLSAGGAMTAVMLAVYPDVFAGGAVVAGLPYRCATSVGAAYGCMNPGVNRTPSQWGDLVRGASSYAGRWPTVAIWHGSTDSTVVPANATELVEQWTNVHGTDAVTDVSDTVRGQARKVYRDGAGRAVVESVTIAGMGHGTPVDPGTAVDSCGRAAAYVLDVDICSSYYIGRFWGLDGGAASGDTTAPSVRVTAPASGATVSGPVTVTADAADNVGVVRVEFAVDGRVVGSDASAPWSTTWDASAQPAGSVTVTARAYDAAGNATTSAGVPVTVSGGSSGSGALRETFGDLDGTGDLYDSPGWTSAGWQAAADDATGTAGSRSAYGGASSGAGCATGARTSTLTRRVTLGASPTLNYARKLALSARVNTGTTAAFRVTVDGVAVDAKSVTYANYAETSWVRRTGIDLAAYAGRTVTLGVEVTANSNVCIEVSAKAWIDDVTVS